MNNEEDLKKKKEHWKWTGLDVTSFNILIF
jgi:hypothetical protein